MLVAIFPYPLALLLNCLHRRIAAMDTYYKSYVYLITNLITQKYYVGKANNPEGRWESHKSGKSDAKYICNTIAKYGSENFTFEILFCSFADTKYDAESIAFEYEKHFIKEYNCCILDGIDKGYNVARGGRFFAKDERSVYSSATSKKKLNDGSHHFISEEFRRKESLRQQEMIKNGTHRNLTVRICQYCNKDIKGPGFFRFHGEKCLQNPNIENTRDSPSLEVRNRISETLKNKKYTAEEKAHMYRNHKGFVTVYDILTSEKLRIPKESRKLNPYLISAQKYHKLMKIGKLEEYKSQIANGTEISKRNRKRSVMCEGKLYSSVSEAQRHYKGIKISHRLHSDRYPEFYFVK